MRKACWVATGCLLTVDGSDDCLVKPEGLPEYSVPGLSYVDPVPDEQPKTNVYEQDPFKEVVTGFNAQDDVLVVADSEDEDVDVENIFDIIDHFLIHEWTLIETSLTRA